MYVSLCFVLPPENWSASLPNKGNALLYLLTLVTLTWTINYVQYTQISVKV